jgi:hypothetical protein
VPQPLDRHAPTVPYRTVPSRTNGSIAYMYRTVTARTLQEDITPA